MTHAIFVYGTLKNGHSRSSVLNTQRHLGTAITMPEYKMYRYGSFPALVKVFEGGTSIFGEIYEVTDSCLMELDSIEGVQHGLFSRSKINLMTTNFTCLPLHKAPTDDLLNKLAFAYFFVDKEKLLAIKKDCGSNWVLND